MTDNVIRPQCWPEERIVPSDRFQNVQPAADDAGLAWFAQVLGKVAWRAG